TGACEGLAPGRTCGADGPVRLQGRRKRENSFRGLGFGARRRGAVPALPEAARALRPKKLRLKLPVRTR
ncbi:MAG: hypothetical protein LBQ79_02200, partial [Deltaproteobacteria bacterium]|nr:hypothetical protein [Deltaproteobacteria bacterium]